MLVLLEAESCILISPEVAEPRPSMKPLNGGEIKKSYPTHTPPTRVHILNVTRFCLLPAAMVAFYLPCLLCGASELNCTVKDVTLSLDQRRKKTWLMAQESSPGSHREPEPSNPNQLKPLTLLKHFHRQFLKLKLEETHIPLWKPNRGTLRSFCTLAV